MALFCNSPYKQCNAVSSCASFFVSVSACGEKRTKRAATKKRKGERAVCDCVQREEENCNGSVRICVIKFSEWW